MSQAIITSRPLKNKATGIDVTVPEYKQLSSRLGLSKEEEYHIIVISSLPYFKRTNHKPADVVQFMVARRYAEFESLRKALDEKFSATVFPELPKKSLVIKDITAQERRTFCEDFLQFVTALPKVCASQIVLEFLGVKSAKIKQINDSLATKSEAPGKSAEEEKEITKKIKTKSTTSDLFGDGPDSDEDLFGDEPVSRKEEEKDDLFVHDDEPPSSSDVDMTDQPVRLFDSPDNDGEVYLPSGATSDTRDGSNIVAAEDNTELLTIDDDLDKLLLRADGKSRVVKPTRSKVKPPLAAKPGKPGRREDSIKGGDEGKELGNDDIMKYILDNTETPSDSLF